MNGDKPSYRYSTRIALGARLKHWRQQKDLKISGVAAALGVSTATWGHWETGARLPSGDLLLALEALTGQPLHVLFCPYLNDCPQLRSDGTSTSEPRCCHLCRSSNDEKNG